MEVELGSASLARGCCGASEEDGWRFRRSWAAGGVQSWWRRGRPGCARSSTILVLASGGSCSHEQCLEVFSLRFVVLLVLLQRSSACGRCLCVLLHFCSVACVPLVLVLMVNEYTQGFKKKKLMHAFDGTAA